MTNESLDITRQILLQKKTGRMSLQLQPLLQSLVYAVAKDQGIPANEFICRALIDKVINNMSEENEMQVEGAVVTNIDTRERTAKRLQENARRLDKIRLYTLTELEPILGTTHRTLFQYVKDGKLRAAKIGGRWKVTAENLNTFLQGKSRS